MSNWSRKVHCRCRYCEARRTFRVDPESMLRVPRCHSCGQRKPKRPGTLTIWRVDQWMMSRNTGGRGQGCNCAGYHFTHRKGSLQCNHHPRADEIWKDSQQHQRLPKRRRLYG